MHLDAKNPEKPLSQFPRFFKMKYQKNILVVEQSGRRGRSPGRVFCLVRCRSEPSNSANQLEPFPFKERKAVSVSPPRKPTKAKIERPKDSLYTNDEIAISFEQVK